MASTKIFYSWSSHNDSRVCRDLIKEALSKCCDQITAVIHDADRSVVLDHDTKGETGSPSITETIERKIEECQVFVADLTPVHVTKKPDGGHEIVPNPNVIWELGYAYRALGHHRVIAVLNTAFCEGARVSPGSLTDSALPFNLRHRRFPHCFELMEGSSTEELRNVRAELTKSLVGSIGPIVEKASIKTGPEFVAQKASDTRGSCPWRHDQTIVENLLVTEWRDRAEQVYVRFYPEYDLEISPLDLKIIGREHLNGIPPYSGYSGNHGLNEDGFITCAMKPLLDDKVVSSDMVQFYRSGEVWGCFCSFLTRARGNKELWWIVEDYFSWTGTLVAKLTNAIQYSGQGRFEFGIKGVRDWKFHGDGVSPQPFLTPDFRWEAEFSCDSSTSLRQAIITGANRLWGEAGLERPENLSDSEYRMKAGYGRGFLSALLED